MGAYVWPVDNWQAADGSRYTGRRLRQLFGSWLTRGTPDRPLGARTAVFAGTPTSTVSVSGSVCTFAAHRGVLDVQDQVIAGAYVYSFDDDATFAVPPADQAQARTDIVVVQVSDPAESDGTSAPSVDRLYIPGQPGQGQPARPARSLLVATVNVPVAGGGVPSVTWRAPFTVALGGVLPVKDSTEYPPGGYVGQYVDDARFGLLRWNGAEFAPAPRGRFVQLSVSADGESIPGGSTVQVVKRWQADYGAVTGGINLASGTYTVQETGEYRVGGALALTCDQTGVRVYASLKNNSSDTLVTARTVANNAAAVTFGPKRVHLKAGDVLTLWVFLGVGTGTINGEWTFYNVERVG